MNKTRPTLTITFTPDGEEVAVNFTGAKGVHVDVALTAVAAAAASVILNAPGMNRQDAIELAAEHNGTLIDTLLHRYRHPVYSRPTSPEDEE